MDLKFYQKEFLNRLSTKLNGLGFAPKISAQSYFIKNERGWATCHLAFIPHQNIDFDATIDVGIRFDEVERLMSVYSPSISKKDSKWRATIGSELGNFKNGIPQRWTVKEDSNPELIVLSMFDLFMEVGMSFIERFSNLNVVLDTLEKNDALAVKISPIDGIRWQQIIAIHYLNGERSRIKELIGLGEQYLKTRNPIDLTDFLEFSHGLKIY